MDSRNGAGTELVFVEEYYGRHRSCHRGSNSREFPPVGEVAAADRARKRRCRSPGIQGRWRYPDDCGRRSDGRARGLPRFCKALDSGKGEFVNSVRLTYPMEQGAMRFANLLGKKFSAW